MTSNPTVPPTGPVLIIVLGILAAFGPMSIDMYLPAMPTLQAEFATTTSHVQLTLSAFTLGFAVGQLFYGAASDRFGRRTVLMSGIVLYVLMSILCALAWEIESLIVFRFLQALGGGAGTVLTRAIVRDLYSKDAAARALSLMILVTMIAPLIAPFLGGYMLKWAGWRVLFWILTGFGAVCLALAACALPETLPPERRRRAGMAAMLAGYWTVLRHRQTIGYMLCGALSFGGLLSMLSGAPFVFIQVYGVAPEHFGYFFAATVLAVLLGAFINSRLVMRLGLRPMLAAATTVAALGGIVLGAVAIADIGGLAAIVAALAVFMLPHNIINANATAAALEYFPDLAGTASSVIGSTRFGAGAAIGALVGLLHDGTAVPMAVIIALCGLGSAAAFWLMTGGRPPRAGTIPGP